MELKNVITHNLDHLGVVAAIAKDLKIAEQIDERLEKDQASVYVTMGGLGFTNEWLYMVSNFFKNKPLERLIGQGVKAEHVNNDALGRLLDSIYKYGTTNL